MDGWKRGENENVNLRRPAAFPFLSSFHDFFKRLALAFSAGTVGGDVPQRNDGDNLPSRIFAEVLHFLRVKVANPASAESTLGGSEAEMLHGDGYVNVTVRLPVRSTRPTLALCCKQTMASGAERNHSRS